ncbi:MAG: Gp138 family membrane-puncturing spike protein [Thiobacillus sp.]
MADGKQIGKVQRDQQLTSTPEEAHAAQIEGRLKDLHTCMPGIIASFNPATQTASVQPAIKRIFTENGAINLPVCVDVPVAFPGGGDFFLTFPVKAGDECILFFSERAIDNWHIGGGTAAPAEYRLHDLSDGIAIVGLNSQPHKIGDFNQTDTELRSRDGQTHITMKPDGTIKNVNAGGSTELTPSGQFIITAPGGIVMNGNTTLIGNMTSQPGNGGDGSCDFAGDVIAQGTSLHTHTHPGDSGGTTGTPN